MTVASLVGEVRRFGKMNPTEHNSRRAVRCAFLGVFVVVFGILAAIFNAETRERLGLRHQSAEVVQRSETEPFILEAGSGVETSSPSDRIGGIEMPEDDDARDARSDLGPKKPRYDRTNVENDFCPVHQIQLAVKDITIEPTSWSRWVFDFERRQQAEFPFAYALIGDDYIGVAGHPKTRTLKRYELNCTGLSLSPGPPRTPPFARMLVCSQCVEAYKKAVVEFDEREDAFQAMMLEQEQRQRAVSKQR